MSRLWEPEHPYYCQETNFFMGGLDNPPFGHWRLNSWAHFLEECGDHQDFDLNLVFRWDWKRGEDGDMDYLFLFVMHQRKGRYIAYSMPVTEADEESVRAHLQKRLDHLMKLWAPLCATPVPDDTERSE